jgi:hypothetical protein
MIVAVQNSQSSRNKVMEANVRNAGCWRGIHITKPNKELRPHRMIVHENSKIILVSSN